MSFFKFIGLLFFALVVSLVLSNVVYTHPSDNLSYGTFFLIVFGFYFIDNLTKTLNLTYFYSTNNRSFAQAKADEPTENKAQAKRHLLWCILLGIAIVYFAGVMIHDHINHTL